MAARPGGQGAGTNGCSFISAKTPLSRKNKAPRKEYVVVSEALTMNSTPAVTGFFLSSRYAAMPNIRASAVAMTAVVESADKPMSCASVM